MTARCVLLDVRVRERNAASDAMNAAIPVDTERSVSVIVLLAIVEVVQRMGIASRDELLSAAGLNPAQLEGEDARVSESQARIVLEAAIELSGDDALGLHWGERLTVETFAPISYLVVHAANLKMGLAALSQFRTFFADHAGYEITESAGRVMVRCLLRPDHSPRIRRFMAELTLCGFVHIVRAFSPGWHPERVSFEYEAPAYRDEYTRFFQRSECFDQPFTGFSFDAQLLEAPSPHKDDGMYTVLRELVERRLARVAQAASHALRVRQFMVESGRSAVRNMESVARGLGMSVRSLRRRLAEEGRSYVDVESEAFEILARRLLIDRALTIQQAAHELGFTSTTSFHRAFKRALGVTPIEFREGRHGARRPR